MSSDEPNIPDLDPELDARITEMEAQAKGLRDKHSPQPKGLPEIDDEVDGKITQLESKAKDFRARQEKAAERERAEREDAGERQRSLGVGMQFAAMVGGVPIAGWGIGKLIDGQTGSTQWTSLCALIGAVLGIASAIYMLQKMNK